MSESQVSAVQYVAVFQYIVPLVQFNASRGLSQFLEGVVVSRMEASTIPSLMRVGLDLPLRSISTLRYLLA